METNGWSATLHKDRVSAIIIKEDKILLIHRFKNEKEYWVLPGGSIEKGETQEEALKREVQEELSLTIKNIEFLFVLPHVGRNEFHYLVKDFSGIVRLGGPELEVMNKDNQYILTWLTIEELQKLDVFYPEEAKELLSSLCKDKKIR
jgi:8-oxo-dGTP pyrophosphatase MutT (NUDIX family)